MTRLELLDQWFSIVPPSRRRATLVALYAAAPQAVKDAMFTALKADLVAVLTERKSLVTQQGAGVDGELAEIQGVT